MKNRFIIVGTGWSGQTIAATLVMKNPKYLVGFVDDEVKNSQIIVSNGNGDYHAPVLGKYNNLLEIISKYRVSHVILAAPHNKSDILLSKIVECQENNIDVINMPDLYAKLNQKIPIHHISDEWLLPQLTKPKVTAYSIFYKVLNYIFGVIGCTLLFLPTLPIIALLIKRTSDGPIFFTQKRVGKNSKVFTLYKYRTMEKDASKNGAAWTLKNDSRITKIGHWLRKFRIDELPQFINIIKGEMSLIGPRPEAVELVAQFKKEIPFYEYRYLVNPGITGWAQVNYQNTCSIEGALEKLQYDLYWIKNHSLWLDLKIIFKSIKVVLTGFGAV